MIVVYYNQNEARETKATTMTTTTDTKIYDVKINQTVIVTETEEGLTGLAIVIREDNRDMSYTVRFVANGRCVRVCAFDCYLAE